MIGQGQPSDRFVVETRQLLDRGYEALQCDNCGATWVGPVLEDCGYCLAGAERRQQWQ
jgi:hypothetical protein